VLYWNLDAKKRFKGPQATSEAELRKIEADMMAAPGMAGASAGDK